MIRADGVRFQSDEQHGKASATRVAKGPAGSHALSGSWHEDKLADFSQDAITYMFKTTADSISMKAGTAVRRSAHLCCR